MEKTFSYHKTEKLKSRKQLDQLFTAGKSFSIFPIKVFYQPLLTVTESPVQAGVGVSSKNFKKAVQRNRIKRLLRESYRLEKQVLYDFVKTNNKPVALFFLYIDKTMPESSLIRSKMPLVLARLIKALHEKYPSTT